jgi:transcriptional regulator with XRE-family HTH domain
MSDIYNRIQGLCIDKGISVSKMCKELSITRSCLSELKSGRTETLSADNIYKISKYFNVPVDFILCNTEPCDDGTFDIYINSRLPDKCQETALTHELEHIKKDHFYNYDSVVINEMVANKAV